MARRQRRGWGTVTPKHTGNRKRFYCEFTGPDGARHTAGRSFETSQDADAWLMAERRRAERDDWTPPGDRRKRARHAELTVGQWLDELHDRLEATGTIRRSTAQTYRRTVTNRITGTLLADMPVNRVKREHVTAWWREMLRTHPTTETTNRNAHKRLRAAYSALVDDPASEVTENPVKVPEAARRPKTKHTELPERAELDAIVEHLPERYKLAGALCLHHGMRVGEVLALRRKHVVIRDREDGREVDIRVRGNVQRVPDEDGHHIMLLQPPKSDAGLRDVPVSPGFVPLVVDHMGRFAGKGPDGLVTPTARGEVPFDTSFRQIFNAARDAAGVRSDLTLHDGRDYLITALAELGATVAEIGYILGQDDLTTIVKVYMKVRAGRPRDLMALL